MTVIHQGNKRTCTSLDVGRGFWITIWSQMDHRLPLRFDQGFDRSPAEMSPKCPKKDQSMKFVCSKSNDENSPCILNEEPKKIPLARIQGARSGPHVKKTNRRTTTSATALGMASRFSFQSNQVPRYTPMRRCGGHVMHFTKSEYANTTTAEPNRHGEIHP